MAHTTNLASACCLIGLLAMSGQQVKAYELRIPRRISCSYGSVIINQVSPAQTYEKTTAAAFTLTVNGSQEAATGIESGNITNVTSRNYYIFSGTGGLTFARHRGRPYFGNDGNAEVICTNSKYGDTSPEFDAQY